MNIKIKKLVLITALTFAGVGALGTQQAHAGLCNTTPNCPGEDYEECTDSDAPGLACEEEIAVAEDYFCADCEGDCQTDGWMHLGITVGCVDNNGNKSECTLHWYLQQGECLSV